MLVEEVVNVVVEISDQPYNFNQYNQHNFSDHSQKRNFSSVTSAVSK